MSVIGLNQVLERVKSAQLVENLSKRELENPEGVGVDLRLGAIHKITEGGAFIEVDVEQGLGMRKGVQTEQIAEYDPEVKEPTEVTIEPGQYYLIQTYESLTTPPDLMPLVFPRSSLFRAGILLLNSKTDPGYKGKLTMGMTNLSPFPVKLQIGARICNVVFFVIEGQSVSYRGQHQGGRIAPSKAERQV